MKTVLKSSQRIALLSLSLFLSCASVHLNAEMGDDEETEEEEECVIVTTPPRLPVLTPEDYERIGNEYDTLIQNWAERIKPIKSPKTELAHIFELPDVKERILNKMGYFPFVWTYFPIETVERFPNLIEEINNEAHTLNNPIAHFNIGWMSSLNRGEIKQNVVTAFTYYQQAAKKNVPLAQYICGAFYHQIGNTREALNYMEKAAGNDLAIAQYALGVRFINNNQEDEGMEWLRKAALAGSLPAQYALGTYLICIKNGIEGNRWLESVNAQGFTPKYDPIAKLKNDEVLQKWLEVPMNDDIARNAQHSTEL